MVALYGSAGPTGRGRLDERAGDWKLHGSVRVWGAFPIGERNRAGDIAIEHRVSKSFPSS